MPCIAYISKKFRGDSRLMIDRCNTIITEYQSAGLIMTVRQLYYQMVSRGYIPNTKESYNRLAKVVNDARLAGEIDWTAIEDRTRGVVGNSHWDSPAEIVGACARQYQRDKWEDQPYQVEVWIEKEALSGVIEDACRSLDCRFLACRGYVSQSEMWRASMRFLKYINAGKEVVIIHLGDHDPSGIDMTRDIKDRLRTFLGAFKSDHIQVERIALNMSQVTTYNPPPNPAKTTDVRFADYEAKFGDESWELDALDPATLVQLVNDAVADFRDDRLMEKAIRREVKERKTLAQVSDKWEDVRKLVSGR